MALIKWVGEDLFEPLRDFGDLQAEVNRLFGRSHGPAKWLTAGNGGQWLPDVDISEEKDRILVKADLPGMKQEDIDVECDQHKEVRMHVVRWILVGMLVSIGVSAGIVYAATPLDGTKWQITLTPDAAAKKAGEKPSKDTLIFQGGRMTSSACVKYGFAHSAYTTGGTEASPSFETEQASVKEGKMSWSGQVAGNIISGTAVWTKKNGQVLHSTFTGKKKATKSS